MGSVLRKDKIGTLSEAGGNISLSPSILTIGGRQYETTTTIQVALPVLSANTRYQVFAVINSGNVELVISQNENSVGPNGFSAWKLVGSFYANGLSSVGFGSFVNIVGPPVTRNAIFYETVTTVTGSGNIISSWWRNGRNLGITIGHQQDASIDWGGTFTWSIPFNYVLDVSGERKAIGTAWGVDQGSGFGGWQVITTGTTVEIFQMPSASGVSGPNGVNSPINIGGGSNDSVNFSVESPSTAFSEIQIEDL